MQQATTLSTIDFTLPADPKLRGAFEQIRTFYEMAAWLTTSLDYARVLDMVVNVVADSSRQLDISGRVSAAVLLFTDTVDGTLLRVAAQRRLTPADARAMVPGREGAIGKAFEAAQPTVARSPHDDPELKYFVAFRNAKRVLCVPMRAEFENFGVLVLAFDEKCPFKESYILFLQAVANLAVISLQNAALYQNLLEEKNRIVDVDEEARKQLARSLHDGPTQSVSSIAMRLSIARRHLETDPEKVPAEMWDIEQMARQTVSEIRNMLFMLRPLMLEAEGLVAALEQLAANMQKTHDQRVEIQAVPDCEKHLDGKAQAVIFQIAEEAVNNARKHAEADLIVVRLCPQGDVMVVEIEDKGVGFDLEALEDSYEGRGSLGMVNLRERAELVEGTLHIETAPGKGTLVTLLVPLGRSNGSNHSSG